MKHIRQLFVTLILGLFVAAPAFAAFEGLGMMRMGSWEVGFSGNANAFWTNGECDGKSNGPVAGGLACGSGLAGGGERDYGDIRDGLLPSWLNFNAQTFTDSGIKTKIHISFQPGTDTGSGQAGNLDGALGQGSVNFRQVFVTMEHESWGALKIGRDLGVFGSDAILQDMTLLGVGGGAYGPGHTTLGRIGFGYPYADWKAQAAWTSPDVLQHSDNSLTLTVAVTDPWAVKSLANDSENDNPTHSLEHEKGFAQDEDTYGYEAKVNWDFAHDSVTGKLWLGYITQEVDGTLNTGGDVRERADAYEIGGKIGMGGFDLVAYYYDGEGIGTTSFLLDGYDRAGNERDSDGWYLQGRYRLPQVGTLVGVSYGESQLDQSDAEAAAGLVADSANLVETNDLFVFGLYHPVGEALNLVAEFSESQAEAHNNNEGEETTFALGAIMFF